MMQAYYPSLCSRCAGIIERNAPIVTPAVARGRYAHIDCTTAPVFIKVAECQGVAAWVPQGAVNLAASVRYITTKGRVNPTTSADAPLIDAIINGSLTAAQGDERMSAAAWPQSCDTCKGLIVTGEQKFWRRDGRKNFARHAVKCAPTDWRIEKNEAGKIYHDLRPGAAPGIVYHLPKRSRTRIETIDQRDAEAKRLAVVNSWIDETVAAVPQIGP